MSAINYKCVATKCFMSKHHAKLEDFDEVLPNNIQFTDIDATTERDGHFLFIEFKSHIDEQTEHVPKGQRIYYEKLTLLSHKITVFIAVGDASNSECEAVRELVQGRWGDWRPCTWDELREMARDWLPKSKLRDREITLAKHGNRGGSWPSRNNQGANT